MQKESMLPFAVCVLNTSALKHYLRCS